jgi:hypothetical protein
MKLGEKVVLDYGLGEVECSGVEKFNERVGNGLL